MELSRCRTAAAGVNARRRRAFDGAYPMPGPDDIVIREVAHGSPEYLAAVELRRDVLRRPLGLDYSEAQLAAEASQVHLVAYGSLEGGEALGCMSLGRRPDGSGQIRQAAVRHDQQGRGVGRLLVEALETAARRRGDPRIVLHARCPVIGFYERLGYRVEGPEFDEVGIPHRMMGKALGQD